MVCTLGLIGITTLILNFQPGSPAFPMEKGFLMNVSIGNDSFRDNVNNSQHFSNSNVQSFDEQELSSIISKMQSEISSIIEVAELSMNGTYSFGNLPLVNLTTEMIDQFKGIPQYQDLNKRNEAKKLLSENPALLYVGLLLPNGDRYFGEPFDPYQINGSVSNFAYRDHFNGALESGRPYLSNTLAAVSTGEPFSILASPIYTHQIENITLVGIQVLGINFKHFDQLIDSSGSLYKNDTRLLLLDNNGTKIGDSSLDLTPLESFNNLQSFNNARNGESGELHEEISGKSTRILYSPLNFAQSQWILLSFSPSTS